jgi:hypothetical protein
VVVLDPVGAWWGLRSRYEIPILGGAHADLPLEPTAGKLLAEVVHDSGRSIVLDTSAFPSKAKVAAYVTDFLDTLYRLLAGDPRLIHVVLEEADEFAPQKPFKEQTRMLAAVEQAVRRGRGRGLGLTMVSQRAAVLNKNVLEQADVLVAMRVTGPNDRAAIQAWIGKHDDITADVAQLAEARSGKQHQVVTGMSAGMSVIQSLPKQETGQAWFWNPERDLLKLVKVRARRSLDVSGRIRPGEQAKAVKLKPIDLASLGERIAETVEKQKENDPKELRARIRELERQVAQGERAPAAVETIDQPVLQKGELDTLEKLLDRAGVLSAQTDERIAALEQARGELVEWRLALDRSLVEVHRELARINGARAPFTGEGAGAGRAPADRRSPAPSPAGHRPSPAPRTTLDDEARVSGPQQKILDALAWFEALDAPRPRRSILAPMADTTSKSSGFEKNLSTLRTAGLIDYGPNSTVFLTEEGRQRANWPDVGGSAEDVQEAVISKVSGPQGTILRVLIDRYPDPMSREELAESASTTPTSSGFEKNLSTLKTLGVIDYPERGYVVALPILFLEAAAAA